MSATSARVAERVAQIDALLRALANPQEAAPMQAYMLDQFPFLGVRATPRRQALKGLAPLKAWSTQEVLALAQALWAQPEREFQYVAVDVLARQHRQLGLHDLAALQQWVMHKSWWDTVDGLAGVVGDILGRELPRGGAEPHPMDAWLAHANLWVRRVAMLHQLGWREQVDEARLWRYAATLAPEKDFFIRKAIGWALRDHARTRPEAVRAFLQQQGESLSGLTRREAAKHL